MQPHSQHIPGADGNALRVLEWSDAGVPLLLLHGFGNEAHIWDELAPRLAEHYRVLALDLRGHGDSAHDPRGRYHWDDHVRDLEALTRALGVTRLVLIGHSFGGRVALLFAGAHPERTAGLALVDTGPEHDARGTSRIHNEVARRLRPAPAGARATHGGDGSFASAAEYERVLARNFPASPAALLARMARDELRARADGRWERKLDPAFSTAPMGLELTAEQQNAYAKKMSARLWACCERVACPVLVVRGAASDVLSAETADKMTEVFKNARLAVIPQAAHSVMTDNPEAFGDAITNFALG